MRVAITGAGGLIGRALRARLIADGHKVIRIGRASKAHPPDVVWSISDNLLDPASLEGLDAMVHLAGEPIFGRWTQAKKQAILDSRVDGTRLLATTLAHLQHKPSVFISASAIGFYGDRGNEVLDETSTIGEGFLPEVSQAWEAAARPATDAGIRVVHPRFGVVLSKSGGALKQMLPAFRWGLGGTLGNGSQWMSWISLDDTIGSLLHLIHHDSITGPVNLVSPEPVTNKQFTRTLATVLKRPAIFPVPRFAVRLSFGQLADQAIFASQRVEPAVLKQTGYAFRHPTLETALRAELHR